MPTSLHLRMLLQTVEEPADMAMFQAHDRDADGRPRLRPCGDRHRNRGDQPGKTYLHRTFQVTHGNLQRNA